MAEEPGLGRTVLELYTDDSKLNAGLDRAEQKVSSFKGTVGGAGKTVREFSGHLDGTTKSAGVLSSGLSKLGAVLSVAAVGAAAKRFADYSGRITDLASSAHMSTTEIQALGYAAKMNGVELETLTKGATKLGRALVEGDKSTVRALETMGLSIDQLRRMEPAKAFTTVADAIAKIPHPMEQSNIAFKLFGRMSDELLPAFKGNLTATAAEAERLGLVLDEGTIAAGDRLGDSLDTLRLSGTALIGKVLAPLVPAIVAVVEWLTKTGGVVDTLRYGVDWLGIGFGRVAAKAYEWGAAIADVAARVADKLPSFLPGVNPKGLREQASYMREQSRWWTDAANAQQLQVDAALAAEAATKKQGKAVVDLKGNYEDAAAAAKKRLEQAKLETDILENRRRAYDAGKEAGHEALKGWADDEKKLFAARVKGWTELAQIAQAARQEAARTDRSEYDQRMEAVEEWYSGEVARIKAIHGDHRDALTAVSELYHVKLQEIRDENARAFEAMKAPVLSWSQVFADIISSIPGQLMAAFQGGGGFGGAAKSIAVGAGSSVVGGLFGKGGGLYVPIKNWAMGLSDTFGNVLGKILPGIGGLVGSGIGWLAGKLFGPSKQEIANRQATDQILQLQDGLKQTYESIENIDKIGRQLGVDLAGAWGDRGQKGLANFQALLDQFNQGLERNKRLVAELAALQPGQRLSAFAREAIASGQLTDDSRAALGSFRSSQAQTMADAVKAYVEGGGSLAGGQGRLMFTAGIGAAAEMRNQGGSLADIAAALGPTLGQISGATGLSNSFLDTLSKATRPEVAAILKSSDQTRIAAASLENLGLMNRETFGDLATGLTDSYEKLVSEGVEGDEAREMLRREMQQAYEMIEDYGYVADSATQQMLEQAKAQGIIGEAFRSKEDQLAGALGDNTAAIRENTRALGGSVSSSGGSADGGVPVDVGEPDYSGGRIYHTGDVVSRRGGRPFPAIRRAHTGMAVGPAALGLDEIPLIAQVGEGILSRRGMVAGEQLVRELNAGRVPGRGGDDEFLLPLTIPIEGEAVVKALVKVRRARRWG